MAEAHLFFFVSSFWKQLGKIKVSYDKKGLVDVVILKDKTNG